jgi:hypothetical protein
MAWVNWNGIHIDTNAAKEQDLRLEAIRRMASAPRLDSPPRIVKWCRQKPHQSQAKGK